VTNVRTGMTKRMRNHSTKHNNIEWCSRDNNGKDIECWGHDNNGNSENRHGKQAGNTKKPPTNSPKRHGKTDEM